MDSKREGVGALFDDYVMSKTRLVDTQDFSTVNAPKKRGRKRKILTEQEALEKKRETTQSKSESCPNTSQQTGTSNE